MTTQTKSRSTTLFDSGAEIAGEPEVSDDTALAPTAQAGKAMMEQWIEHGPEAAIKRIETAIQMLERIRKASIAATYPSDWIIHTSTDSDGALIRQVGYLQDVGAERAGKPWGIGISAPAIEREDFPDGTYSYHMIAEAWSRVTGERFEYVEGSRWSGAGFFQRKSADGPNEKVDPTAVRKSAWANLHGRAVRSLAGLNAVPLDQLTAAGIDTAKVVMIAYQKGAKGGESAGASVGTTDATVAFGKSKGMKVTELADNDLAWYAKAYAENVADESKAKYKKSNDRILTALRAEQQERERRKEQPAEARSEPDTQAGAPTGGTVAESSQAPATRGGKINAVWSKLEAACGKDQKTYMKVIRVITGEWGNKRSSLTDLKDEELEQFIAIPPEILKTVVANLPESEKAGLA